MAPAVGAILRILRGAKDRMKMQDVKGRMIDRAPNATRLTDKLIAKFPCKLGRDPDCVIRFTGDRQISRHHAQITVRDGRSSSE